MALFRSVISEFGPRELEVESVQVPVNVKLWRVPGCHELLASLGFDLMEVGRDEVTLKTCRNANKRQIQFALQALVALFDTDEAPRSLNVDSSDSMEDYHEDDQTSVDSPSPPLPIPSFPGPRKSGLVLDGSGGAFSSYARNRGEPDGRQAQGDSPTGSTSSGYQATKPILPTIHPNIYHQKGRESDCNFTPSPVDNLRGMPRYAANYSLNSSRDTSSRLSSTYSPSKLSLQGSKFKHGPSPLSRPESCSSTGSLQDWDAQGTVVRRHHQPHFSKLSPGVTDPTSLPGLSAGFRSYLASQPVIYENAEKLDKATVPVRSIFTESGYLNKAKLHETSGINDKLSIRAEVKKSSVKKEPRLEPGVTTRVPPTGESNSPKGSTEDTSVVKDIRPPSSQAEGGGVMRKENLSEPAIEHIITSQMRRINRELPISEVYHERNLGLGLAPPLSKLIMSNNIAVAQVDHHPQPELEKLSSASSPDNINSFDSLSVMEEAHHPLRRARPKVAPKPEQWTSASSAFSKLDMSIHSFAPSRARDEGDGRSMTDSQYSGYSPSASGGGSNKDLTPRFNYMKIRDTEQPKTSSPASSAGSSSHVTTVINTNIRPSDVAHYINSEFLSGAKGKEEKGGKDTKHPHLWQKDRNGRFTYTGNFASDC